MWWLIGSLVLLAAAIATGLAVLHATHRPPAPPVRPGMSRLELDIASGDPELAALARGTHTTT
jgi:hypothetical protein